MWVSPISQTKLNKGPTERRRRRPGPPPARHIGRDLQQSPDLPSRPDAWEREDEPLPSSIPTNNSLRTVPTRRELM